MIVYSNSSLRSSLGLRPRLFAGLAATIPIDLREKNFKMKILQELPDELDEETFDYLARSERVRELGGVDEKWGRRRT